MYVYIYKLPDIVNQLWHCDRRGKIPQSYQLFEKCKQNVDGAIINRIFRMVELFNIRREKKNVVFLSRVIFLPPKFSFFFRYVFRKRIWHFFAIIIKIREKGILVKSHKCQGKWVWLKKLDLLWILSSRLYVAKQILIVKIACHPFCSHQSCHCQVVEEKKCLGFE